MSAVLLQEIEVEQLNKLAEGKRMDAFQPGDTATWARPRTIGMRFRVAM